MLRLFYPHSNCFHQFFIQVYHAKWMDKWTSFFVLLESFHTFVWSSVFKGICSFNAFLLPWFELYHSDVDNHWFVIVCLVTRPDLLEPCVISLKVDLQFHSPDCLFFTLGPRTTTCSTTFKFPSLCGNKFSAILRSIWLTIANR